ncbi:MAG TPA: histidine kinase dimerization/phosphoacceptor domain -containing protein [Alicycliphilus sp.]|nr:histidine kinase dimerization/phosphoacceptor domain -containing protein [Alicycliphilus sp.]
MDDFYRQVFEASPDGLLLVARDGRIAQANGRACTLFGYVPCELNGQAIEVLIPQRFTPQHAGHRQQYFGTPRTRSMGVGLALFGLRKDGSEFPADIMLSPLDSAQGSVALCVVRDISERRRTEQLVLDSLKEKEVLLKEIHHRVKNNLAVISSLFSLQSSHLDDEHMKAILRQSQDRVRSMAMVHESLYSHNLAEVDFAEYVTNLSTQLVGNYSLSANQVQLSTQLEPVLLSIDMAVPCGLILNELVTNSLKHGLANGRQGRLRVTLRRTAPGFFALEVADDGRGLPPDFDLLGGTSLGKRLIRSLVKQIDGGVQFLPAHPGTRVVLTLPLPPKKPAEAST